jgi:hypothetical protein
MLSALLISLSSHQLNKTCEINGTGSRVYLERFYVIDKAGQRTRF